MLLVVKHIVKVMTRCDVVLVVFNDGLVVKESPSSFGC